MSRWTGTFEDGKWTMTCSAHGEYDDKYHLGCMKCWEVKKGELALTPEERAADAAWERNG